MTNLVASLLGGVLVIATLFWSVHRFSRMSAKAVALWLALAMIGIYIPYSILFWPGADVFAIHLAIYLISVYGLGIVFSSRESGSTRGWHWGPVTIVGFFMVVVSVDAVFIMLAQQGMDSDFAQSWLPQPKSGNKVTSHFPGVVSHDFQQKESQYNAYKKQLQRQKELSWQVNKGWLERPLAGQAAVFKIEVQDLHGKAVGGAEVMAKFLRPSNIRLDQSLRLVETAAGEYLAEVNLPLPGRWDLVLNIRREQQEFEVRANTTVYAE